MLLALALLAGCTKDTPIEYPPVEAGPPVIGAAEGTLDLPVGTPLGGYTARCQCLAGISRQDARDSAYSRSFVESTGVQMREMIKAIWLENGDDAVVMIKTGVIYSHDQIAVRAAARLTELTGHDLTGKVTLSTGHSHHSYGPFNQDETFYLGGDYYNEEILERYVAEIVEVAMAAYDSRQPAAIGTGWVKDWDPDNEIYSDRRGENGELVVWDDQETPGWGKDPFLNVTRIDALDGTPIAVLYSFGIHGITLGDNNSLVSPDSTGGLDMALQDAFDFPVVTMHVQAGGGDASPRGRDREMARLETLGELARPRIMDLWEQIETSSDPIRLQTASRAIPEHHDQIHVTRGGTVDWRYTPLEEGLNADDIVYDENGELISPIDEFNAPYGAVFCGEGGFDIPVGGLDVNVFPYDQCMNVDLISQLLVPFFELDAPIELPMRGAFKANTTVSRWGPIPTLDADGTRSTRELLVGFFPGETTAMYVEQWRRRAHDELGYTMPLAVGYSQDHEGYLLIPEDWLMGGYEPDITVWGPLQGEHIMEGMIATAEEVLAGDEHVDPDPTGIYAPTDWPEVPLPTLQPDTTPDAGTRITTAPEYLWIPDDLVLDLDTPDEVSRVTGLVQLAWQGGDPAVDLPRVVLEREVSAGTWEEVQTHSGRPVTDTMQDILEAWTPTPLFPAEAVQTHAWWACWQAVGHDFDRAGLPAGTYRLHVSGKRYTGGDTTWPWSVADYEVIGDAFELVPATITVTADTGGVWASIRGPEWGYRLIDLDGSSRGDNPVRGDVTVSIDGGAGTTITPTRFENGRTFVSIDTSGATSITVTDAFGNSGTLAL